MHEPVLGFFSRKHYVLISSDGLFHTNYIYKSLLHFTCMWKIHPKWENFSEVEVKYDLSHSTCIISVFWLCSIQTWTSAVSLSFCASSDVWTLPARSPAFVHPDIIYMKMRGTVKVKITVGEHMMYAAAPSSQLWNILFSFLFFFEEKVIYSQHCFENKPFRSTRKVFSLCFVYSCWILLVVVVVVMMLTP